MVLTIILTIIVIDTIITLLVFNINAEQQAKIFKEQNEFNNRTVELFKDISREQIELYSKAYNVEFKINQKELEDKLNETRQKNSTSNKL